MVRDKDKRRKEKDSHQLYIESLSSGKGFSRSNSSQYGLNGVAPSDKSMSYRSTPHYLREVVGAEKAPAQKKPPKRSSSGAPAYRSAEEYYDEVLDLRKELSALKKENSVLKGRLQRKDEEHSRNMKEMDNLLNPDKSDDMRRTLADSKVEGGAVVYNLKQKVLLLEHRLKEKESAFERLQNDVKTTRIDELKLQLEVYHNEVLNLRRSITTAPSINNSNLADKPSGSRKDQQLTAKMKALNEQILRLNENNTKLQVENKTLKIDIDKTMKENITLLEKLKSSDGTLRRRRYHHAGVQVDLEMGEDDRTEELKDEIGRLKKQLEHSENRKRSTDHDKKEIRRLQSQIEQLERNIAASDEALRKMQDSLARAEGLRSPRKRSEASTPRRSQDEPKRRSRDSEKLRRSRSPDEESITEIQSAFRGHLKRKDTLTKEQQRSVSDDEIEEDDGSLDDAASVLQSTFSGHSRRKQYLKDEEARDEIVELQGVLRGHSARKKRLS